MEYTAFDTKKIDEYTREAKEKWGSTPAFREFEEKEKNRTPEVQKQVIAGLMGIFEEFGSMKDQTPDGTEAQGQVQKLRDYITEHFYQCSIPILSGLGKMYAGGGEMTANIDLYGGEGTAEFAAAAIETYCRGGAEE